MRRVAAFGLLALLVAAMPAGAQQPAPDGAFDPAANEVHEQTLLQQNARITGRIDIPDARADVLVEPAGRQWDYFHEVLLHWFGVAVIVGTAALLAAGYFLLGRLRMSSGRSGRKVLRFTEFERFAHWLAAVSFVLLGLTGLNITFGKHLILPLIGPAAFSALAQAAKYVHHYVGAAFVLGLLLICALWIRDNLPRRVDIEWIWQGGGFIKSRHAPAGRFNAGEKAVFWSAMGAGTAVIVSGYLLLFPFAVTGILGMQVTQAVHAVVAVLFVAVIMGHAYIGTLGTEGAFEAMATGDVDLNWAREHHDLWLAEQAETGRTRNIAAE